MTSKIILASEDEGDITTPPAGKLTVFADNGALYIKDDAGNVTELGAGGVTGVQVGSEILTGDVVLTGNVSRQSGNAIYVGSGANGTHSFVISITEEEEYVNQAGTNRYIFRLPYGFTVTAVRASLRTAQTSGTIITVDINVNGGSMLSTKLTIDNGEKTSVTAATQPVLSTSGLLSDDEIAIDLDAVGDGTAQGLKVYLIGYAT